MRIQWNHESTVDFRNSYGDGMRLLMTTRYPEGMILLSEARHAIRAARRAYARYHDVPVSTVTASPVYTEGRASIDHVNAYISD